MNDYLEKRKFPRKETSISATIEEEKCHIMNLSYGGAMVLTTFPGKIGQDVCIHFKYNNNIFVKKSVIREVHLSTTIQVPGLQARKKYLYQLHLAFNDPIREEEFLLMES
jgi:hypothetical protein